MTVAGRSSPSAEVMLLAGICALLAVHAFTYSATIDDAFITFRYSNNLLAGHGPVYNPGEYVEGYTSFTWMLLMAAAGTLHSDPAFAANVLGVIFGICGLVVTWQLARRLVSSDRLALLAPLLLAVDRTYAGWCTGGVETALFTTLILLGLYRWLVEMSGEGAYRPIAGIVFGIATLTRPEGAMFFSIAMFCSLLRWRSLPKTTFASHIAAFVAIVGVHLAWRYSYYGELLPNTFYCKVNGLYWKSGLAYLLIFLRFHAVLPLVFVAGLIGWACCRPTAMARTGSRVVLLFIGCQLAYILYIGGDVYEFRFMDVVMPFVALGSTLLVKSIRDVTTRPYVTSVFGVAVPVALVLSTAATTPIDRFTDHDFEVSWPMYLYIERLEPQSPDSAELEVAAWLNRFALPGESIAIDAAGLIPFYSNLPTLDILGLNDAHIAHLPLADNERGWIGHEKNARPAYIRSKQPTYFFPGLDGLIAESDCPEHRYLLEFDLRAICIRSPTGRYFSFFTFRPYDEFKAELIHRGARVVELELENVK